jgi:hypothetical protein
VSTQLGPERAVGPADGLPSKRVLVVVGLVDEAALEGLMVGLVDGLRCDEYLLW